MPGKYPPNEAVRRNLEISQGTNEFENLLENLIVELIPTVYVEGYKETLNKINNVFPQKPKVILTGPCFDDKSSCPGCVCILS